MKIKEIHARKIFDSRGEGTIQVFIKTEFGIFSAGSPSGKSRGKYEKPAFIKSLEGDINIINNIRLGFEINYFEDLEKVEDVLRIKVGANTMFALESAIVKALAAEKSVEVWQLLNEYARKFPAPVGNCVGGGLHTKAVVGRKPDFQEFLVIPRTGKFVDNVFLMNKIHENIGSVLTKKNVVGGLNDEGAWSTSLTNEQVLEILNLETKNLENETDQKVDIGIDVAASTFYTGLIYNYKNPQRKLNNQQQVNYISNLARRFDIFYIEDPLHEEAFEYFSKLREGIISRQLIVGDDLTVSNPKRFVHALRKKSINAVILKPNQIGSLIDIKKIINLAKRSQTAIVISHRSGETLDTIIADLAFGWEADFIKTGIRGKEREVKLKRMIEIESKFLD